jgi:hypothetical protein
LNWKRIAMIIANAGDFVNNLMNFDKITKEPLDFPSNQ